MQALLGASVSFARVRRDTHKMLFRLLGIATILGMAVGLYVGIHSAIRSLYDTRDAYYQALHVADAELRFVPEDRANVPDFSAVPGVKDWESRLIAPGQVTVDGKGGAGQRFPSEIVAQTVRPDGINALQLIEGRALDARKPTEVLLDRNFAAYHHIRVGDALTLRMGNDTYRLTVRGIALSAEHLVAPANPSFFIPIKGSMAVIYAPIEMIGQHLGFPLVNSLVFRLDPGVTASDAVLDALTKRAQTALTVEEALPLARHLGHLFMNVDLGAFSIFVPAVIVIFLLAALVVGFFLIYRWVEAQRQTLGVFLALGYCRFKLLAAELYPIALIAVVALVVAAPTALAVSGDFAGTYSKAVGFPAPSMHFYPGIVASGVAGLVIVVLGMALWPLSSVLRLTPAAAIRGGPTAGPGTRIWHGRLLSGLRHHPTLAFPLRNVVRGLRVGGMTMVAVALAIGVSISYFIAANSFNGAIQRSFTADKWNVAVDFLVPVWRDELGAYRANHGIARIEEVLQGPVRLDAGDRTQPATLTGYDAGHTMRRPTLTEGALPGKGQAGIVLEQKLAVALHVGVGGQVQLTSENRRFTVRVAGIFSGAVPGVAYAPIEAVRTWFDMPDQLTGLLLDMPGTPPQALDALRQLPRVGAVTAKSELAAKVAEISSEAVEIIYLSAAFSIAVSIIILIASGTFTVSERQDQYTTLRTLGFSRRTVARFILVELCVIGLIGAAAATPVGQAMAAYLVSRLSAAWFDVRTVLHWGDVLLPTVPLLLLLPLSALPPIRAVVTVPLIDAIKQRRYG